MQNSSSQISVSERKKAAIIGAIVADAASLGLHWIYDAKRILEAGSDAPEFLQPLASNYEGVSSYFAHPNKKTGDNTHYGDQSITLLESLAATAGQWSPEDYQRRFFDKFGPEGNYDGYLDTATKDTIARIQSNASADQTGQAFVPLGSQDTQAPAMSKLPPLVAQFAANPALLEMAETAIRITNDNDEAVSWGLFATRALEAVILGKDIEQAITESANQSDSIVKTKVDEALSLNESAPGIIGETLGMACNLHQALPVSAKLLQLSASFMEGVRKNIFAGGDNAGRSLFIGAILGAAYGVGGENGIPQKWIDTLSAKQTVESALARLEK